MHGEFFFACSKRSRTREAPTPTNISTKSEPEMEKNGTPASPATALAKSVLPVPGGPTSSTPFGMRAPSSLYLRGFLRNSTISLSSSFSSSAPATSAKVVLRFSSAICFIFALPKFICLPASPMVALRRFIVSHQNSMNMAPITSIGRSVDCQKVSVGRFQLNVIRFDGCSLLYFST